MTNPPPAPIPPKPNTLGPRLESDADSWKRACRATAFISGIFCAIMAVLLALNYFQGRAYDPLNAQEIVVLKSALTKKPADEKLKGKIRAMDLEIRRKALHNQTLFFEGAWLLLGGAVVFALTLKSAAYRKKLPRPPKPQPGDQARLYYRAGWTVTTIGVFSALTAYVISQNSETLLVRKPETPAQAPSGVKPVENAVAEPAAPTTPVPTPEEIKQNWPRFRGPDGRAIAAYTNYPAAWNAQSGENIIWKVPVPIFNPNSPVVWRNRLFLSGANAKKREIYCFDTQNGKLLWQKSIDTPEGSSGEPPTVMEDSGAFAAATTTTDGRRVYAIFATGDVGAVDYKGNMAWAVNLGKPDNSYGHASSLLLYQDRLLVLFDQGGEKDHKSKLLALDTQSGKPVWQTQPRPVPSSWATPILVPVNQKEQVITCGNPWVIAYDPANGNEIWRVKALYGEVTPSPVFGGGYVFTANEGEKLSAIRPDGTGDVTKTHVKWTADDGLPDICSPLCDDKYVYLTTSSGTLTCYNIADGKMVWNKELELPCKSSPSLAGDRIFLVGEKGTVVQFQAGPEYKELSRSELGEEILSSPAFMDGRIYIRGKQSLFCIGKK